VCAAQHFFKEVISVSEDDKALDAFYLMVERDIQGLAVIDKEGKLVGNLSIRDLKIIGPDVEMFWRLQQTVKNFLVKVTAELLPLCPQSAPARLSPLSLC
jgi:CBS-domain-containing membrane protein